jgi:hypothetical protein
MSDEPKGTGWVVFSVDNTDPKGSKPIMLRVVLSALPAPGEET